MKKSDIGVEIIKVANGFLVKTSDGTITVMEEDVADELSVGEKLLWMIIEFFCLEGSRHDKERISVVRAVGDKYTLQTDEKMVHARYTKVCRKK